MEFIVLKKSKHNPLIKNLAWTKNLTSNTVHHINIAKIKQTYRQIYNIYTYVLHWQLLILNQMNYDESHHTWSLWKLHPFIHKTNTWV